METTKVVLAQTQSKSLRTTVPAAFARTLGIEEGTLLGWDLQPNGNGFALMVRVVGKQEPEMPEPRKARKKR